MTVHKTAAFIADVERQFEWYARNASWEVAEGYLRAVEESCLLLRKHPQLGPLGDFIHPRLSTCRFFVVFRPFRKHLLFYEIVGEEIIMRRAMHGRRDLPQRLLEKSLED
jgi:plasmid stabilization system protein ParE